MGTRGRPRLWYRALGVIDGDCGGGVKTSNWVVVIITAFCGNLLEAEAGWVLRGGVICSMDDTASHYCAMAFTGNRLTWLGESEAAAAY